MHRLSQPLPAQLGQYIGWVRPSLCIAHQFQHTRWVIFEETLNGYESMEAAGTITAASLMRIP
jgi:hypothetical protein